ncbi:hypothetical protein [Nonomuraea cavernae]|uniref:Uncharacterized protein n=1 Tax=Nonomuraea cavernae TaxID=2045107 RepID=A0A917YYC8_9ACTN|nr:hypothetical protein [Nonomuraea cavernae]MCA2186043.1 hypothetical protein [Nonomuraea cavernae]GGO70394.1 hypothetical protein GCM10012289_33740 [Nonomuraea cavernae]
MNHDPYTYVTLTMAQAKAPRLDVSFHTSDIWIRASVIDQRRPYLTFSASEAQVSFSTTGLGPVTDGDLATAREIYKAAAQYLADCERLHAQQPATGQTAA